MVKREDGKIIIEAPLTDEDCLELKAGDRIFINGVIFTGRDSAHKKLMGLIEEGKDLPFDLKGQIIYYVGPTPPKPGQVIGSAGPTTSGRMDAYTAPLHDRGLKATIGKGQRSEEVKDSLKKNKAIYIASIGGTAALAAKTIKKVEVIAYEELGTEAIRRMEVEMYPAIVANDCHGGDLFEEGVAKYKSV